MTLPAPTLRNKLLLFTALLVLLPGVAIGVLAERSARASLREVIGGRLAREAHHTAAHLSDLVAAERDTLRSFARQDVMREIRIGDVDKRITLSLRALQSGSDARIDALVLDEGGKVVAATRAAHLGRAPGWAGATRSAPFAPRPEGLVLGTPVPDPDNAGASLGHLVELIDWRVLGSVAQQLESELGAHGIAAHVMLVDASGGLLASSRHSPAPPGTDPWAAIAAGTGPRADFTVDRGTRSIVGRAALDPPLRGVRLLVAEPLADAFAPVGALRRRIAWIVLTALASALAIAAFAARRVTQPLAELSSAIEGLARGDVATLRVTPGRQDEVSGLAAAFNRMSSELERTQRHLVEAEKFAFVGELASGVAHEVRTSLGVLRSSTQMLLRSIPEASGGDAAELAGMIGGEVDRLGSVVNELLHLGRPRPLQLRSEPLSQCVFRAAAFVVPRAEERGVRIVCQPPDHEAAVRCDPDAIHQVVVNLLVNAIEALDPGGRIDLEILPPRGGCGGFRVRDDGPGPPEELRERIFQPFVTAREGGVGLGLTLVKRIVHEHRGRILLEPAVRGTSFRIEVPLAEEEA